MVEVGGIECCAIGSDLDGMHQYPRDFKTSKDFPALFEALLKRGFTEADIYRIVITSYSIHYTKLYENLTGITTEMLQGAPNTREVLTQFHAFCEGACLVAHNAEFDMGFVRFHSARFNLSFNNQYADTLMLSRYLMHDLINHKLDTLCEALVV